MRVRLMLAVALLAIAPVAACGRPAAAPPPSGPPSSTGVLDTSAPPAMAPTGAAPDSSTALSPGHPGITVVAPPSSTTPAPSATRATVATAVTQPTSRARTTPSRSRPVATSTVTVPPDRTSHSSRGATSSTARHRIEPRTTAPATAARTTAAPTTRPRGTGAPTGKVVVIDPGHNGANASHPEIIHQQVPAGFGQYKDCNTTGTATNAGYPEYRFNWKVALALREMLQSKGITVVMTRDSDDGVGPCVNKRAAIGNDAHADAVVSIHGDGESASIRGFYVMTASRAPAGAAMAAQSSDLAGDIRDGLAGAGFPTSNAIGQHGLWTRSDLAGLNLSVRPTVMIECGNMRNATEAALMSSASGQQRYADGIAAGVLAYLTH